MTAALAGPAPATGRVDLLLRADEAIRRQSVHSIAGVGMGLQWLLAGSAMWVLAGSDVQILRSTM